MLRILEQPEAKVMDTKPFYSSRTFWVGVFAAITPIITTISPPVGEWLRDNADWVISGLGFASMGLRAVTNKSVTL